MREMILATRTRRSEAGPREAVADATRRLLRGDLPRDGRLSGDHPLLDPPLHEFLPKEAEEIEALASQMGKTSVDVGGSSTP
ncbi:MAG: hypothetical protein R2909_07230 [Gemmatimonadales bacterium]